MAGRVTRAVVTGSAVALVVHAAIVASIMAVYDRLPQQIVTHWGPDGATLSPRSDAFRFLIVSAVLTMALGAIFTLVFRRLHGGPRLISGLIGGLGSLVPFVAGATVLAQVGDTRPGDVPAGWIALGLIGAVAIGALASRLVPRPPPRPDATFVPPADRSAPTTWSTRLALGPAWIAILTVPVIVLAVLLLVDPTSWTIALTVALVMAAAIAAGCLWQVTADSAAVTALSVFGWPRLVWRLAEIERAEAITQVEPMAAGGYGVRVTPKGLRFVFRRGPGVRIELSDGTDVIFTTDDAAAAARTINALITRQRAARHPAQV